MHQHRERKVSLLESLLKVAPAVPERGLGTHCISSVPRCGVCCTRAGSLPDCSQHNAQGGQAHLVSRTQPAQRTNCWLLDSVRVSHHTFSTPSSCAKAGVSSLHARQQHADSQTLSMRWR